MICEPLVQFARCCAAESTKVEQLPQTHGGFAVVRQKTVISRPQNNEVLM